MKVWDEDENKMYALKIISVLETHEDDYLSLLQETEVLARVNDIESPYVAKMIGYSYKIDKDATGAIIHELRLLAELGEVSLFNLIDLRHEAKHDWKVEEVGSILGQMAIGVDSLHKAGIFHRDIKPQNAVITQDGKIKLIDFGIAGLYTCNQHGKIKVNPLPRTDHYACS